MANINLDLKLQPKQEDAFYSPATEILFGGASGGGKSHLVRVALIAACVGVKGMQATLIRKKYSDIWDNHVEGTTGFKAMLEPLIKAGLVVITREEIRFLFNGSRINFVHCFTAETMIQTTEGNFKIKDLLGKNGAVRITANNRVGFRSVRKTRTLSPVVKLEFEDGYVCECTPDHRFTTTEGVVEARHLEGKQCLTNESALLAILNKSLGAKGIRSTATIIVALLNVYIESFGSSTKEASLKVIKYITSMRTRPTIKSRTWSSGRGAGTQATTQASHTGESKQEKPQSRAESQQSFGTPVKRVKNGIRSTIRLLKKLYIKRKHSLAKTVVRLWRWAARASTVRTNAGKQSIERNTGSVLVRSVQFALTTLRQVSINLTKRVVHHVGLSIATKKCVKVTQSNPQDVYCLTVPSIGLFPLGNGVITFNCQDERQWDTAQGIERQFMVMDEATQIPERLIRTFRTWVRAGEEFKANLPPEFKGMFPRILYTANPVGISLPFFRKHFVKSRPAYDIAEVEGFKRQFIPSSLYDNEAVDPEEARARIEGLGDPKLSAALITGDWDSPLGDFYSNYSDERLTIPDFEIPPHWYRFRAFDWGSAEPFACLWAAVADGDSHDLPAGCIVIYREWNGCDPNDNAKGLHYRNEDIAQGIVRRSEDCPHDIITLTDSFPFRELGGPSIASIFATNGVTLRQADTSRVLGWKLLRDRMEGNKRGEPMVRVFESCEYLRYYWPMLQRHKTKAEDAVEDGEATHLMDCARYLVATYPKIVHKIETPKPIRIGTERPTFNDVIERHNRMKNARKDW